MQKKTWIYTELNKSSLTLIPIFKKFRDIELISSLDSLSSISGGILICINITINLQVAKIMETLNKTTKILITNTLDSVSLKNMNSLFDDVYIGDTRDALVKYLSNTLRGFYD